MIKLALLIAALFLLPTGLVVANVVRKRLNLWLEEKRHELNEKKIRDLLK